MRIFGERILVSGGWLQRTVQMTLQCQTCELLRLEILVCIVPGCDPCIRVDKSAPASSDNCIDGGIDGQVQEAAPEA